MDNSATSQYADTAATAERARGLTVTGEVEQRGKIFELSGLVPRIGELGVGVSELVKERVHHGIDRPEALRGRVLEKPGDEVNRVGIRLAEHLVERVRLDLGKLVFHVVGVHGPDLLPGRCSQNFNNLHQLVNS